MNIKSFIYALNGIKYGFKTQYNLRFHFLAVIVVFIFAYILDVSVTELAVLTLTCSLVISLELINTAIENLVDIYSGNEFLLPAKYAKDTAAGAVLIAATGAFVIGLLILVPHLINYINTRLE